MLTVKQRQYYISILKPQFSQFFIFLLLILAQVDDFIVIMKLMKVFGLIPIL